MKTKHTIALVTEGLSETEVSLASDLHSKYPKIGIANQKLVEAGEKLKGRYFELLDSIRTPAEGVKLNGKEVSLILRSLGYNKVRVSEMRKVMEVSDDLWAQYRNNVIGFKPLLALARGKSTDNESGAEGGEVEGEGQGESTEKKEPKKAQTQPLPGQLESALCERLNEFADKVPPLGGGSYYFLSYVCQAQSGEKRVNRRFVVSVEVADMQLG